jgi:DNA invertase Pin-like site-specific DNA recombinase
LPYDTRTPSSTSLILHLSGKKGRFGPRYLSDLLVFFAIYVYDLNLDALFLGISSRTTIMTTHAYLRVSTDRQDVANQRHGILEYANAHGLTPVKFVEDAASGRLAWRERELGRLLCSATAAGDVVIFAEISRMARSTLIVKQRMILDGSLNSRISATVLGLAAEIERELIAERTREALAKRKAEGKPLGRPKGVSNAALKLDVHASDIRVYLDKGVSKRSIAKLLGCAESTLYDWLARRVPAPPSPVSQARR